MSFEKYKDYKDTGVLWIERIPSHWLPMRLKHACLVFPSNVDKKSYEDQIPVHLCNYTDVYYNEKIVSGMDFMKATATQEQIEKFTLKAGDTIITKDSETADDIGISAFVPNDIPGVICGYHLSMVRPKSCSVGNYVKYFFTSHFAKSKLAVAANGLTRVGLSQYSLDNIYFPIPPIEEQRSIANFLDHETAKIDSLSAEQEKLIELLKEKRQTVISQAVTKGLDSNVKMKDSGVEWLGRVPEHWDVIRLKKITTRISSGKTPSGGADVYVDSGVIFLRSQNIYDDGLRLEDVVRIPEKVDAEMSSSRVKGGDILLNITGGSIGRSCCVPNDFEPANVNQHVCAIRLTNKDMVSFVELFFKSAIIKKQIDYIQNGAAREGLNFEQIGNFSICIPPPDERNLIVEEVSRKIKNFNDLTSQIIKSTTLLQERRSALISAAVCGKISF